MFALSVLLAGAPAVVGAPKARPPQPGASPAASAPAAAGSAAPAALPTATPEPPETAIPRLEAKLKTSPDDREAAVELAGYYLSAGRADKVLPLTQKLLTAGQKNAQVYYLDGLANQQVGRVKEATASLEQAANLEPTNSQVLLTLTDLYLRTNRPADAERVAKRATTFNKDDKRAFINYGLVLAQEKKYDEARAQFETAAKLDPKDAGPVVLQARSYIDQRALALAGQLYDRALSIDGKSLEALNGKARLLAAEHNVKDSIATYEQLLALVPETEAKAAIVDEEASVYAGEKMNGEAETAFKRAISQYPNALGPHVAYGDYLASQQKLPQAEAEWTLGLGAKRDNRDALQRLGEYYLGTNPPQAQKGLDNFKRMVELAPNDPAALDQLGEAYGRVGQHDKARETFRRVFDLTGAAQPLAQLATADFQVKNYKECSEAFDALQRGAGDFIKQNPRLYLLMGQCYDRSNQKPKAKSAYERLLTLVDPKSKDAGDIRKLIADLGASSTPRPTPKATTSPKK